MWRGTPVALWMKRHNHWRSPKTEHTLKCTQHENNNRICGKGKSTHCSKKQHVKVVCECFDHTLDTRFFAEALEHQLAASGSSPAASTSGGSTKRYADTFSQNKSNSNTREKKGPKMGLVYSLGATVQPRVVNECKQVGCLTSTSHTSSHAHNVSSLKD